jgi:Na+/pantothenate symporter
MKYPGCYLDFVYPSGQSMDKTVLTIAFVAATYISSSSSSLGGTSVGMDLRYCLSSWKTISACSPH